jgi:hypothetical protein
MVNLNQLLSQKNIFLKHLDLSNNKMPINSVTQLLKNLGGEDSTMDLETLNLSDNILFDEHKYENEKEQNSYTSDFILHLKNIFIQNQSLSHIDLSATGLSESIIFQLIACIKTSPSLVGVHLTNNSGITTESKVRFARLLGAINDPDYLMDYTKGFEEVESDS